MHLSRIISKYLHFTKVLVNALDPNPLVPHSFSSTSSSSQTEDMTIKDRTQPDPLQYNQYSTDTMITLTVVCTAAVIPLKNPVMPLPVDKGVSVSSIGLFSSVSLISTIKMRNLITGIS